MSVSASVVRKIMRGSVWARNICSALIGLGIVTLAFVCITAAMGGIAGQKVSIGPYIFSPAALEPLPARVYVVLITLIGGALMMASLLLIRAVFADLALGNIFCEANVRRIRNLGWLTIAGGVGGWLVVFTNAAFFMLAGHHEITYTGEPPV